MGDRYVIGFRSNYRDKAPVWLYSHNGGEDRMNTLALAIEAARPRWNDPSYATRIAISTIIGNDWGDPLGFGITAGDSSTYCEPDHDDVLIVNWGDQTVSAVDVRTDDELINYKFEVFVSLARKARLNH